MTIEGTFDAVLCDAVVAGTVVVLRDDKIVYAGPIKSAPSADGVTILLQAGDFEKLQAHIDRHRH
jgi:hypothetical protein